MLGEDSHKLREDRQIILLWNLWYKTVANFKVKDFLLTDRYSVLGFNEQSPCELVWDLYQNYAADQILDLCGNLRLLHRVFFRIRKGEKELLFVSE